MNCNILLFVVVWSAVQAAPTSNTSSIWFKNYEVVVEDLISKNLSGIIYSFNHLLHMCIMYMFSEYALVAIIKSENDCSFFPNFQIQNFVNQFYWVLKQRNGRRGMLNSIFC